MTERAPDNQRVPSDPHSPEERRRRTAWSLATLCAIETGKNPVDIYNQMLDQFRAVDMYGHMALDESNESE
jgi:hypothetical protein